MAKVSADEQSLNADFVQQGAVAEGWLLITEDGGQYLESFDTSFIPPGFAKVPGPLRPKAHARSVPVSRSTSQHMRFAASSSGMITYQVLYQNIETNTYEPVPQAHFTIRGCNVPPTQFICEEEDYETFETGVTNASGELTFLCPAYEEYDGWVQTSNSQVTVAPGSFAPLAGELPSDCGSVYQVFLGSGSTRSFVNTNKAIDATELMFGTSRPHITVHHDPNAQNSYYSPSSDKIVIRTASGSDHVWYEFGIFTAAHEYAHAFHAQALGGYVSPNCGASHHIDEAINMQCAFVEGFADYVAVSVRPDVVTYVLRNQIAGNAYFPGCVYDAAENCAYYSYDGSIIEGAFAAFLYDLTDPGYDESHDAVSAPGAYLRDVLQSCETYAGGWSAEYAVDHVVYCIENAVNPGSYFATRPYTPTAQREAASESAGWGWSTSTIRALWQYNLYTSS